MMKKHPPNQIIYLTGLSLNKITLHNIFKSIGSDCDFPNYLSEIHDILDNIKKEKKRLLNDIFSNYETADELLGDILPSFPGQGLIFKYLLNKYFHGNETVRSISLSGDDLIENFSNNKDILNIIKKYEALDLYSLYLSNQSDSRGVSSLASGNKKIDKCYSLNWAFADLPFYKNKFIDSVELSFNQSLFKKIDYHPEAKENSGFGSEELIREVLISSFYAHGLDILISRALSDIINMKEDLIHGNLHHILNKLGEKNKNEFSKSMSQRSLFGIALFSRCLASIAEISKYSPRAENEGSILSVFLESNDTDDDTAFLREFVESAGSPEYISFTNSTHNCDIAIKISNPLTRQKDTSNAFVFSDFFMGGWKANGDSHKWVLRIPVKLMLSLPLIGWKVSQKALFPSLAISDKSNSVVNVITSGGVEHNRPLMHLINRHRYKYKDKRIFGFLDNHFDFFHRWKNDGQVGFEHLFIMGVNQPVSAFNQIVLSRQDGIEGESLSLEAKQIYFEVDCPITEIKAKIISIYGFSAMASVFSMVYTVTLIKQACRKNNGIINLAKEATIYANDCTAKGLTVLLRFEDNVENNLFKISEDTDVFSYLRLDNSHEIYNYITKLNEDDGAIMLRLIGRVSSTQLRNKM